MDLCANQLVSFVSNASKQLKNLLGEVDQDSKPLQTLPPTQGLPSPSFSSPVPSPTPSSVSSMSDQEVPSMSPGLLTKKAQRRGRKRISDSISEATMVEYPMKARRANSVGDYDEFVASAAPVSQQYLIPPPTSPSYRAEHLPFKLYNSCQYERYEQFPTASSFTRQQPRMLQYQQQQEMHNLNNYGSSQLNWPTQNTNSSPSYFSGQQQENVPDFADLVSWMLAEDFIDSETLAALLTQ